MPAAISEIGILAIAFGIGVVHMLAPDHWVPLTIYCHSKNFSVRRSASIAAAGGIAHVLGSLVAAAVAVIVGFALVGNLASYASYVTGGSFVLIGVWMFYSGLKTENESVPQKAESVRSTKWLVFATASSPELTVLPVYLAATSYGFSGIALSLVVFAVASVASVVVVTIAGVHGMGRFLRKLGRERQIDFGIAIVLGAVGLFAILGG